MKRQATVLLTILCLMLGVASASASRAGAATSPATLRAVTVSESGAGGELFLRLEGTYSFATSQPTGDTLLIDVKGARASQVAKAAPGSGSRLAGYRLLQYRDATGQPVVRVQIELKHPGPVQVQQDRAGLRVHFGEKGAPSAKVTSPVGATPAVPAEPVSAKPASPAGPLEVSGVLVRAEKAGEAVVDVATNRSAAYRVLHLKSPSRLVVDLEGAHNAARQRSYAVSSDVLKGVRLGQFRDKSPAVVRVVADLTGDPAFDVHAYAGGVRIELRSRSLVKPAETAAAPPEAAPAPVKAEEKVTPTAVATPAPSLAAEPAKKVSAEPQTEVIASKASAPATAPAAPAAPAKPEYQSTLPASTPAAAVPRPTPQEKTPESLRAVEAAHTLIAGAELLPAASQGGTPGTAQEAPKYTGEPISLNLKDVDLKDFFRLIHEISGLNIIVDPNVAGSVTLVLDSVPWDQALDIVLKNNGLGKQLEGNVLRIAKMDTLTAEQESSTKLAAAREEAAPLVTIFRPINYAKAAIISTMLKSWVGGGALTKRGSVLVDDRTNTVIVSDIQTQIPIIESIIGKLDKKAKQVVIEARIVLATAAFSRNLSSALAAGGFNNSTSVGWAGASGSGVNAASEIPATIPTAIGSASRVVHTTAATASGFGAFTITNWNGRFFIEAAISAAETKSQAKTISRPTIVTQNNVAGTVTQGTQIPIQTTVNNTISISYTNAALTMTVTPQVTEDGNIFMIINVNNSSPGAVLTTAGPSINTQSATTQVLVPDGGTVVFGGVTVTSRSRSATYVPLIGNIPIIGHLFKTSNVQDNDNELLFFVTPKVLAS